MPTPTYIPLQTITLGSAASSVTFASIPQTYRDLVLVSSSKMTTASYSILNLNGNTSTVYSSVNMAGDGSSTDSGSVTQSKFYPNYRFNESTSEFMLSQIQFLDYSATDKHKSALARANLAGSVVNAWAGRWANNDEITSIAIAANSGNFAIGSTFSLYGIEA